MALQRRYHDPLIHRLGLTGRFYVRIHFGGGISISRPGRGVAIYEPKIYEDGRTRAGRVAAIARAGAMRIIHPGGAPYSVIYVGEE